MAPVDEKQVEKHDLCYLFIYLLREEGRGELKALLGRLIYGTVAFPKITGVSLVQKVRK